MDDAKRYLEVTHQCSVNVTDEGDWCVFRLDDTNPRNPVVGIYPKKDNIFYPRGANNYYFSKKIRTQKTLYFKKKSDNSRKVISGHLVVASNPKLTTLKVSSYNAKGLEVNLEHLFEHIKTHSAERTYLMNRLNGWLYDEPRDRVHSIEGCVYVRKVLGILSGAVMTGAQNQDQDLDQNQDQDLDHVHIQRPPDPAGEAYTTLVALFGTARILMDHLLLAIDTICVDKLDKSFMDADSPTYWRVDDKEAKLLDAFKAVVDEGQLNTKKKRSPNTVQAFKDRFTKVFNQHATMSDAWHPLHESSLQELIYMPSISSKGGSIDSRYYQPYSLGFICFVYTKEGQDVGLVRYMAQGCRVSKADPDTNIQAIIAKLVKEPDLATTTHLPVLIDGLIVGYIAIGPTPTPTPTLHWTQYTQETSFGTVINLSPNGGILYREVVDSEGNSRRRTIQQQVHQPLVWDKDIFLPSPESFMSTMAASLPLIQHSSAVRGTFACSQRKSASSGDASEKVFYSFTLTNPEAPRIRTATEKRLGVEDGQNVVVGIMPFYGKNTEDAIVVSKEAVTRGDFHTKVIDTHTLCAKVDQHLAIPLEIQVGSHVVFGQLLGSVTGRSPVLNQPDEEEEVLEMITHQSTHTGKIIDIRQVRTQIQIVVETVCPLMVGDKLASRYGQKGVVSELVPLMDMPYTADGVRPSILINPHAFPTRMTLGQMIESILVDTHAIGKGRSLEITAFQSHDLDPAHDCMRVVYNPKTFRPYPEKVFVGIVYYHTLKHKVDRKVKARGRFGKRHQLTGQPVGSRKLNGGLRIGEMENGILMAQGADLVLKEFYDIGDGIDAIYCHTCGRWDYGGLRFDEHDGLPIREFCAMGGATCGPYTHHRVNRASLQLCEEMAAAGIQMRLG